MRKSYGYKCTICGDPIKEPQPTEHTDDGLAHAKCCRPIGRNNMKPEEQIEALAKLDGWTNIHDNKYGVPASGKTPPDWKGDGFSSQSDDYILPHYLEYYDKIIPILRKLDGKTQRAVERGLMEIGLMYYWDATPAQIAELILRATNLWKDSDIK